MFFQNLARRKVYNKRVGSETGRTLARLGQAHASDEILSFLFRFILSTPQLTPWGCQPASQCNSCPAILLTLPCLVKFKLYRQTDTPPAKDPSPAPEQSQQPRLGVTALILIYYSNSYSWTKWLFSLKMSPHFIASAGIPKCSNADLPGPAASHLDCSNDLCNLLGFHLWLGGWGGVYKAGNRIRWSCQSIMSEQPAKHLVTGLF